MTDTHTGAHRPENLPALDRHEVAVIRSGRPRHAGFGTASFPDGGSIRVDVWRAQAEASRADLKAHQALRAIAKGGF